VLAKHGAALVQQLGPYAPNGYRARVLDPNVTAATVANELYESGQTLFSHPNFVWPKKKRFLPNDTLFPDQWYLRNTGQGGGTAGADISAEPALFQNTENQAYEVGVPEGDHLQHYWFDYAGDLAWHRGLLIV